MIMTAEYVAMSVGWVLVLGAGAWLSGSIVRAMVRIRKGRHD